MTVETKSAAEIALADYEEIFKDFAGKDLREIFSRFAKSVGNNEACACCGGTDWLVVSAPPDGLTGMKLFSVDTNAGEYNQFTPMIIANCTQCGMVRMHETGYVHHWWKSQQNNEGS